MSYDYLRLPIHGGKVYAVWHGDTHIGTVEFDDKYIYGLFIRKPFQKQGHGRLIAKYLLGMGKKPLNIKKSAVRFWKKMENELNAKTIKG